MSKNELNVKVNKNIDLFWDSWLESVKKFNKLQSNFEEQSYKAFNNVEQLLEPLNDLLKRVEEESSLLTKEFNEQLQKNYKSITTDDTNPIQSYWIKQIDEVSNQTQSLFWNSNKALFNFISTSQQKMNSNIESIIKEQQKGRTEIVQKFSNLIDEIKKAQKTVTSVK